MLLRQYAHLHPVAQDVALKQLAENAKYQKKYKTSKEGLIDKLSSKKEERDRLRFSGAICHFTYGNVSDNLFKNYSALDDGYKNSFRSEIAWVNKFPSICLKKPFDIRAFKFAEMFIDIGCYWNHPNFVYNKRNKTYTYVVYNLTSEYDFKKIEELKRENPFMVVNIEKFESFEYDSDSRENVWKENKKYTFTLRVDDVNLKDSKHVENLNILNKIMGWSSWSLDFDTYIAKTLIYKHIFRNRDEDMTDEERMQCLDLYESEVEHKLEAIDKENPTIHDIEVNYERIGFDYRTHPAWKKKEDLKETFKLCNIIFSTMVRHTIDKATDPMFVASKHKARNIARRKFQHNFKRDGTIMIPQPDLGRLPVV